VTVDGPARIDTSTVAALYAEHAAELQRFLMGVLRDSQLASDVLQTTFTRMVEQGHCTREESRKAWLFRVAYREALAIRRRQAMGRRHLQRVGWTRHPVSRTVDEAMIHSEQVDAVRQALSALPLPQRQVVRMRVYEDKTFAQIAAELGIPLGTALGRMRSALMKLRRTCTDE
jgi:RNA polymerase sigma-70 factor (ECF subfamily)